MRTEKLKLDYKTVLILGDINFLDPQLGDKEYKAIVNKIGAIMVFDSEDQAEEMGEKFISELKMYECYLIPSSYEFDIEFECENPFDQRYDISQLSKDDLRDLRECGDSFGFEDEDEDENPRMFSDEFIDSIPESVMERLASKLSDDYGEQLFWTSLRGVSEWVLEDFKTQIESEK